MKLYEIIEAMETPTNTILVEELVKYKKSLFTYYSNYFTSEPILMVTDVMNAAQYARITDAENFTEDMILYLEGDDCEQERELISFQSMMLKYF